MLTISILAFCVYGLVIARCGLFCWRGGQYRVDDRAEIAFLMASCIILMFGHVALWTMEPWKMINNSMASAIVVGHSIFMGSYIYHRVGVLMDGRDRRRNDRRHRDAHEKSQRTV